MKHLLGIAELTKEDILSYLDRAQYYSDALTNNNWDRQKLSGKVLLNLFFENSTRTLTSFEMAAKRLGAEVINWNKEASSLTKGESFTDTIDTLNAYKPDAIVLRHSEYGAPNFVAKRMDFPVINGGDSWREHPTQALLDALTMHQHFGRLEGLNIAIVGDIAHSRVASSNMALLTKMGAHINIIAPEILMPKDLPYPDIQKFLDLKDGIAQADVIMSIRPQKERMESVLINDSDYYRDYGLTHEKLTHTKPETIVMDPGPFLRNLQISDELAEDHDRFIYRKQVANGIPTRMAVLDMLISQ